MLKDTLVKTEGGATQPGTSEEGVVSKKSSEASSEISETKNAEHKSESFGDKAEASDKNKESTLDVSEKDKTPDSNFLENGDDVEKVSEKPEDLKSESENSSETSAKTSSEILTGDKVLETSSTKEQAEGTSENENLSTKQSSSDTSLGSTSSSANIPKGPTTTPTESHSNTINPQESSSDNKLTPSQSEPADDKTSESVSDVSEKSDSDKPMTSQSEPADSKASVSGLSDKDEKKESDGAVAMTISSTTEEKPEGSGNETAKLTQEQLDSLFVKETQENLLGLIGAILPKDSKVGFLFC